MTGPLPFGVVSRGDRVPGWLWLDPRIGLDPGGEAAAGFAADDPRVRVFERIHVAAPPDPIVRLVRERLAGSS